MRVVTKYSIIAFIALFAVICSGCIDFGYVSYRPNEDINYKQLLTEEPKEGWLWIRGKASGDIDGDRKEEEVVIATVQTGTPKKPGSIDKLILMIVKTDKLKRKILLHKQVVYLASNTLADTAPPDDVALIRQKGIMTNCSVKIADTDISGKGVPLLSLWGDEKVGGGVFTLHVGYIYKDKKLMQVIKTFGTHSIPQIESADIDKDGKEELFIRHNLIPTALAPQSSELEAPEWLTVFSHTKDGKYVQNDTVGAYMYETMLPAWNNNYILAIHDKTDKVKLTMFETYIGLLHFRANRLEIAKHYLKLAIDNGVKEPFATIARNNLMKIHDQDERSKPAESVMPEPELRR